MLFTAKPEVITAYERVVFRDFSLDYWKSIKSWSLWTQGRKRYWRRSWQWCRRRGSDVIEEFLVWQPALARVHTSEGFEPRKVIEVKEEDGYEENVKEDFAVVANDKDDGKVWNLCGKFLVQWWVFQCSRGRWRLFFDDEELIFNCGNFIISVKCSVLISFFHFRFTLISNEFKEEADDKNGDDKEDKGMKTNSCEFDNVNLTIGRGLVVGSEEIKEQFLARTSKECKNWCLEELWRHCHDKHVCYVKKNYWNCDSDSLTHYGFRWSRTGQFRHKIKVFHESWLSS